MSDRKREKGYQKVTEKESEWPTPFSGSEKVFFREVPSLEILEILENVEILEFLENPQVVEKTKEIPTIF